MADRNMMDGVFYRRIDSLNHLMDTVCESDDICNLIKRFSDIRLIIVDSIAFHFRYSLLSTQSRLNVSQFDKNQEIDSELLKSLFRNGFGSAKNTEFL